MSSTTLSLNPNAGWDSYYKSYFRDEDSKDNGKVIT